MAGLLQQYSIESILVILIGVFGSFSIYVKFFYGGFSEWAARRAFDRELPKQLEKIREGLKEEKEHSQELEQMSEGRTEAIHQTLFSLQENIAIIRETLNSSIENMTSELQAHSKELQIQKDCNRQTMREIIRKQYEIYQRDGYISRSTLEWLEDVYQSYHSVYGNGVATGWMEEMRGDD